MDAKIVQQTQQTIEQVLGQHFKIDSIILKDNHKDYISFCIFICNTEFLIQYKDGEVLGYGPNTYRWQINIYPKFYNLDPLSDSDFTLEKALSRVMNKYKMYYIEYVENIVNIYNSYFK